MKKLRVCIFTHTFPRYPGDTVAPFMGELAEAIARKGQRVFVLTPFDRNLKVKNRRLYKIIPYRYIFADRLHILGYSRTLKGDKTLGAGVYLLAPLMYLFAFMALLKLVRKEKIDVICSHWIIPNGFIAALVAKITKIPFTVTIPGSDIYLGSKNFIFRNMVGVAAKAAGYVISDSYHYLKQLNDLGYYPENKTIIPYGVNSQKFVIASRDYEIMSKLKINSDSLIVLAVGRMVSKKGFVYLVEAMPKVIEKIPEVKLILVGDGGERNLLEKKVKEFGIERNVIFAGTISYKELSKYYNLADIFIMPSIKDEKGNIDASPVALMEAMMTGLPVVASRFSGNTDFVKSGKTGYLVREKDSFGIANSILRFFEKDRYNMTKETVRKIAQESFSVSYSAKKYVSFFREVLESI